MLAFQAFLGSKALHNVTEQSIYEWLQAKCRDRVWRQGRVNRALPQRVVVATLQELG